MELTRPFRTKGLWKMEPPEMVALTGNQTGKWRNNMTSLQKIRDKIRQAEQAKQSNSNRSSGGDGVTFPFWDKSAPNGSTSVLRFLPDGDENNTYFWVERQLIKLEFTGVKGQDVQKPVTIQVPCMEMWKEPCPILTEVRQWFNGDADSETLAKKYWKKRTYIFQGFVREAAFKEENIPENPIRKFVIGPQLFGIIQSALMDEEMDSLPIDYVSGLDFRLNKDEKGKFADYTKSSWARRESALTEDELVAIDTYGLVDLSTYLQAKPTAEAVDVMFEMFTASVNGEQYDPDRWGKFFKPYGLDLKNPTATTAVNDAASDEPAPVKPAVSESSGAESLNDEIPFDTTEAKKPAAASATVSKTSPATAELLARIRRQQ